MSDCSLFEVDPVKVLSDIYQAYSLYEDQRVRNIKEQIDIYKTSHKKSIWNGWSAYDGPVDFDDYEKNKEEKKYLTTDGYLNEFGYVESLFKRKTNSLYKLSEIIHQSNKVFLSKEMMNLVYRDHLY